VISVWAYNNNGDWLWVDGICKKQLMDKNIDDLFRLAQMYNPQQVGVEVTGQQGGFIPWIRNEMMERNQMFTLASEGNGNNPGIRPNTNKMQRFNVMVPQFKMNKIFFPEERRTSPEMVECMSELSLAAIGTCKSKHDDFIDTISMLSSLTPWKPTNVGELTRNSEGENTMWDLDEDTTLESNMDSYVV
jgi:phage terminase large subunit-like protein